MAAEAGAFAAFPLLYEHQFDEAGIEPYECSEVWFMGFLGHAPNYFVDISSTLELKVKAALEFEATLELLAQLFSQNIDPANVTEKQLKKLSRQANNLLKSITLPGHFDNFQEMVSEMLGNPPAPPKII